MSKNPPAPVEQREELVDILWEHLEQISQDLRAIWPDQDSDALFTQFVHALGLAGQRQQLNIERFFDLFYQMAAAKRLKKDTQKWWNELSHPANLDLPLFPEEMAAWIATSWYAQEVKQERKQRGEAANEASLIIPVNARTFFITAISNLVFRKVIHRIAQEGKYDLSSEREFVKNKETIAIAILEETGWHIEPSEKVGREENIIDFLSTLPWFQQWCAENGQGPAKEVLQAIIATNAEFPFSRIKVALAVNPADIQTARKMSIMLYNKRRALREEKRTIISPSAIYNLLYEKNRDQRITDPILYAWVNKLAAEDVLVGQRTQQKVSLVDAWDGSKSSHNKPENTTRHERMRVILKAIENLNLPIYCLEDLRREAGINLTNTSWIIGFLMMRNLDKEKLWRREKATGKWVPEGDHRALLDVFGLSRTTEAFAKRPAPQKTSALPLPESPSSLKESDKPDSSQILVERALELIGGRTLLAEEAEKARKRLKDAATNGKKALVDGLPSLPHMLLMMADKPETRQMKCNAIVKEFFDYWKIAPTKLTHITLQTSLQQQFFMTCISATRATGQLFKDCGEYINFVAETSSQSPTAKSAKLPTVKDVMQELSAWEGNQDHKLAEPVRHWLAAVNAPVTALFLGLPKAKKLIASLG
jgi:hypothetical protein